MGVLSGRERSQDGAQMVELLLTLFRNILSIPNPTPVQETRRGHRLFLQDRIILKFAEVILHC